MIFLDTETCGLCGPAVIIQWAEDDGPIHIHNFWKESFLDSLKLMEKIANDPQGVVGFNLAFDWFQIAKLYTMFDLFIQKYPEKCHEYPEDFIAELADLEPDARNGKCIKPVGACDLMLVARKTKYQITMNRGDIRIRRVPSILAKRLAKYLEEQLKFRDILFARRKDKYAPKWKVYDCEKMVGGKKVIDTDFKDVVLKFKPSVALKNLAIDALNINVEDLLVYADVEVDHKLRPNEIPYAPFAKAVRDYKLTLANKSKAEAKKIHAKRRSPWRWAWPDVIRNHISHWEYNSQARVYANADVVYTRGLYKHFGNPPLDDDDSILACMVGCVRWKGYAIDIPGIETLRDGCIAKIENAPVNVNSQKRVKEYLCEVMDPSEMVILEKEGTKRVVLEDMASKVNSECPICQMMGAVDANCEQCKGTNLYTHPAAVRAREILDIRFAKKEKELYDKLLLAGRFHASFKVIGALSSRMSGADGLNPQGIKRDPVVRSKFIFADPALNEHLELGDFDGFEVVIADAAYDDPKLRKALTTKVQCPFCNGTKKVMKRGKEKFCDDCDEEGMHTQKIHGLFGMVLAPGKTYIEIAKSKNATGYEINYYDLGKRGVFSVLYGGNESTLVKKLRVSLEIAQKAYNGFTTEYPGIGKARGKIIDMFCSMRQEGGLGTKIVWNEPAEYIESLTGFRRYFTLENMVSRSLFNLAQDTPKDWKLLGSKIKVVRRDREQTGSGALASAIYSAAFQLQAANMRAAANHVIQSTGAQITKKVQRDIWDIQPAGVHEWIVQPCNVHDEIICVVSNKYPFAKGLVKGVVDRSVEGFRGKIPLIKLEWKQGLSWADK